MQAGMLANNSPVSNRISRRSNRWKKHLFEPLANLAVIRPSADFQSISSPVDGDMEQIVGEEIVQAVNRVIQLGHVVARIAVNARQAKAAARIQQLAHSAAHVVENVRQAQDRRGRRIPSTLSARRSTSPVMRSQSAGKFCTARPLIESGPACCASRTSSSGPAMPAMRRRVLSKYISSQHASRQADDRLFHEALPDDLSQMDEHLLPDRRIDILEDEHLGQRRIAVVFHRQPRIFLIGRTGDDAREQDRQLGRQQPQVVDLVQKLSTWRLRLVTMPNMLSIDSSLNARFCSSVRCELSRRSGLPQSSQSPARRRCSGVAAAIRLRMPAISVRRSGGSGRGRPRRPPPASARKIGKIIDADQRGHRAGQSRLLVVPRGNDPAAHRFRPCTSDRGHRPDAPARPARPAQAARDRRIGNRCRPTPPTPNCRRRARPTRAPLTDAAVAPSER